MSRAAAPVALVAVAVATLVILVSGHGGAQDEVAGPTVAPAITHHAPSSKRPPPATPAAGRPREQLSAGQPVAFDGIGALDPEGDGHEHDDQAPQATDGDPATYWATEMYSGGLPKSGVGLVLDAGRRVSLARLVLTTDTPGFTAQIKEARDSPSGPYTAVSQPKTVAATSSFSVNGAAARYYLIWITQLDQVAEINEVRGRAR